MPSRSLELEFRKGNKKWSSTIYGSHPQTHTRLTQPLSHPVPEQTLRSAGICSYPRTTTPHRDHAASAPAPASYFRYAFLLMRL